MRIYFFDVKNFERSRKNVFVKIWIFLKISKMLKRSKFSKILIVSTFLKNLKNLKLGGGIPRNCWSRKNILQNINLPISIQNVPRIPKIILRNPGGESNDAKNRFKSRNLDAHRSLRVVGSGCERLGVMFTKTKKAPLTLRFSVASGRLDIKKISRNIFHLCQSYVNPKFLVDSKNHT